MQGEVIIKLFYFYYFRFRQHFERAMFKNQNQKKTLSACADFFSWAQSMNNATENCKKKIADGWGKI